MADMYPQASPYVVTQPTIPYVVTQQPFQAQNVNPFRTMANEWSSDLCGCCNDVNQCCYAYWCWCCFVGSLANSIGESNCSCWCVPYALSMYRMKVRSILQIKGDTCNDHCATSCCPFCAALQMRNELTYRGIP